MKKIVVYLMSMMFFIIACNGPSKMIDKTVVKELDLQRYLGNWYEIARYDNSFESGLVGVTASYSLRDDGMIKVVNSGYKKSLDGPKSEVVGKAKIPNLSEPSKLKVSFFWIFYSDYFVLELDKDYKWAIVGSSSDDYLWILSRTPQIDKTLHNELISKISNRGYDISKLINVEQKVE